MAKFQAKSANVKAIETADAKRLVLEYVGSGIGVNQAMSMVNRQSGTLRQWLNRDPVFARNLEDARQQGASRELDGDKYDIEFAEFSKKFLNSSIFPHQQNWVDVLEGRDPSWLHPSMVYEPADPTRLLINVPPEHAKSTTITVNYSTFKVCMEPDNTRIIVISKTLTKAQEFVYSIKQRLTHPMWAKLQATYAPPGGWREDADSWKANAITLSRTSTEKDPTIQALGIGGQVYGARANLIILDDCVTGANAHEWEKQLEWIQKEVVTRLDDEGILLIVGTRFAATDLYREIRNPKHWSNGKSPFTYFSMPAVLETAENPKDWVTLWAKTDQKSGTKKEPDADGLYSKWDGPALYRRRGEVTPTTWALVYQQQDVQEDSIFRPVLVQGSVNGARKAGPLRFGAVGHPPKSDFYTIMGIDPAMSGKTAAVMMAFDRRTQVRHILDVYNMEDPNPQKIRALMEDWVNKYSPNELRVEINAHQKAYALDEELNQWLASRGIQFRSHFTGKNKWDIDFGVASMAALFGTERDGKYQDDALIELPSSEGNEHVKSLINQLITWAPGVKKTQATDCVMALWFCEIRVKELIQQMGFAQSHNYNKYATRAGIRQRGVVNLDELAAATYADLYQ
jgi:hypothetical protein